MTAPPTTLFCTQCKKNRPLSAFFFSYNPNKKLDLFKAKKLAGKPDLRKYEFKITPMLQCNKCRAKKTGLGEETRSLYLSALWKMLKVGYIVPSDLDYEYTARYESLLHVPAEKLQEYFGILEQPNQQEQQALLYLHAYRNTETELENFMWQQWAKS